MENKENRNIGALWIKESKKGKKFLSGVIELDGKKSNIVIFRNENKSSDRSPDYSILLSLPREGRDNFKDDIPF